MPICQHYGRALQFQHDIDVVSFLIAEESFNLKELKLSNNANHPQAECTMYYFQPHVLKVMHKRFDAMNTENHLENCEYE